MFPLLSRGRLFALSRPGFRRYASTHTRINVPTLGEVDVSTGLFIDNAFRPSSTGDCFQTYNPATSQPIADVAHASSADVDEAVAAARKAFNTTWGMNIAATDRAAIINKLADLIERDAPRLAALESLNSGKGVRIARDGDIVDAVACFRYYAGMADKIHGQTHNSFGGSKLAYTMMQPVGVCGQILPYNYPIMMMAWKTAAALAAGCTIVVKPSELTPLTALAICELGKEAGLPNGVLNTVPGLGSTTGSDIAHHMGIDKVAFTGSVATGRRISIAAASSNLKKVTLELGGKSPLLVFPSADIKQAADWTALGVFYNTGQDCTASSRVYVHESIFETYVAELKQRAEACAIGQPFDEATSMGPLISAAQREKVRAYIQSGIDEGATVVTGGLESCGPEGDDVGYWQRPTIFTNTRPDMKIVREEIFGPVVCVIPFSSEEEVLALANDTEFGLSAGVFTQDISQAARVTQSLQAGTVWVNQYGILNNQVPFGGFKSSGIGRELGPEGIREYCQVKSVHHNLTQSVSWPV